MIINGCFLVFLIVSFESVVKVSSEVERLKRDATVDEKLKEKQSIGIDYSKEYGYIKGDKEEQRRIIEDTIHDKKEKQYGFHFKKHVQKRSTNGTDIYGHLAGISGGSVIHADKDNISKAVDVLSTVTLTNPVIIKRMEMRINDNGEIPFYVDNTITQLAIEIKTTCCKPDKLVMTDPSGANLTTTSVNVTLKVDTLTMTYVMISRKFVPGRWILSLHDIHNQIYDVTVHGSSLIDCDLTLCDSTGNTVTGQPIPGSNSTYVKVSPIGTDLVSNWTYLQIKGEDGAFLQTIPLGSVKGSRRSKAFLIPVVWPNKDAYIGVIGEDKDGNTFTREQTTVVQPVGIRLKLNNSDPEFIHACFTPLSVPFMIKNTGVTGTFHLQAEPDNPNFLARISPATITISSHMTVSRHCDVTLKSTVGSSIATQVIISAIDLSSKSQYVTKSIFANSVTCSNPVTHSIITTTAGSMSLKIEYNSVLFLVTAMVAANNYIAH